jgi:hypothetical protein
MPKTQKPTRKTTRPENRMRRLVTQVRHDQYAQLKNGAAANGRTIPAEIRMALDHWYDNGRR